MDKYQVEITDEAFADAILTLDTFPEKFELFDSEPEHSWGLHRMVVDNYLVSIMAVEYLYDIHKGL